jgi:hypothetical protein
MNRIGMEPSGEERKGDDWAGMEPSGREGSGVERK